MSKDQKEQAAIRYSLDDFYETGKVTVPPTQVLEDCGLWEHGGQLLWDMEGELRPHREEPELYDSDFDVDLIADQLNDDRLEALADDDDPTEDELKLWREAAMKQIVAEQEAEDLYNFQAVRIWSVSDDERAMFIYTLHSDWGEVSDEGGPFKTMDDLEAALDELGNFSL